MEYRIREAKNGWVLSREYTGGYQSYLYAFESAESLADFIRGGGLLEKSRVSPPQAQEE